MVTVSLEVVDDVLERVRPLARASLLLGAERLIMHVKVIKLRRVVHEYAHFFRIDAVNVFDDGATLAQHRSKQRQMLGARVSQTLKVFANAQTEAI